ncbi:carbohydrate ABC transporter substrate-binding protein, CUT1 family [Micromonospora citrea]|uniref:Carbohydrate ABC transporter substrate-binding protein, CUT1 family n=1 Tax=Micromonospora citrea TaxID=47855 RepID=A0A1C6TRR3_9ACTN|nr:extracellular solute-binding protein [Micromonospora citrea]SCL44494.1 carbohydrate ABC transporter substrate-binding protein, CUT1 family [Micromonospora citrea]
MTTHPRSSYRRRDLFRLIGLTGVAAATAACAGPGGDSGGSGAPKAVQTGKPTGEVSFAHWRGEDRETFDKLMASFTAKFPDAKITQDIAPSNDYNAQALQRLRGGNVGDAFATFRGAQFENFVKAQVYTDLSGSELLGRFEPGLLRAGAQDGKQYGLPYQVVFPMPLYNADIFERAGVTEAPADWDGFLALCEKLKGQGVVPIAWPGGEPGNAGQLFNSMVSNNAPTDDMCTRIERGEAKCTDDWFLKTLEQYAQLRPYFQPSPTGTAVEPAQQLFATGKAAMLATGSYHLAAVRALGAKFPMNVIAPITTSKDKARNEGVYNATFILGVNAKSDVQPAALAWLDFLSDPANAATYANATAQHLTVKGVDYTNADLKATQPWLSRKTLLAPRFQFLDLDIRNAVEGACVKVVGGTAPQQAAEEAQRIVDQRR